MRSLKTFGRRLRGNQCGDTIVEVLIAIGIISTILTGAYVVTNRSLISSRESQERGNALKLSQGQLERLKTLSLSTTINIFDNSNAAIGGTFCIDNTNNPVDVTNAACRVDSEGKPTSEEPIYKLSVKRDSDNHTFTLTTTWSSLKSKEDNQVQLSYKVY